MNITRKVMLATAIATATLLLVIWSAWAEPPLCGPAGCTIAAAPKGKEQATCPVMGGEINKKLYADVKGHRIYVCCGGCINAIKADPDKYILKVKDNGETPLALAAKSKVCSACGASAGSDACGIACKKVAPKAAAEAAKDESTISTAALAALRRAKLPLVVLDARTGKFDDGRRIPGAKSLSAAATAEQAAALIKTKDTLVVTYCSNLKCPASSYLAKRLAKLGYKNVIEYAHGIDGWTKAGNAVVKMKN